MGVIDSLRSNKYLGTAVGVGLIILAGLFLTYQMWPERKFSTTTTYFTDDDGKTWYTDDINNIPPYSHNGKDAVRAIIYSYANGSKQFCGYLIRFSAANKKAIESQAASMSSQNAPQTAAQIAYGINFGPQEEVKKPNSTDPWVSINSEQAKPVLGVKSPDGSELDTVLP